MTTFEMIPSLIRACIEKNENSMEVIAITMAKSLRKKNPEIAAEIDQILFNRNMGTNAYRSIGLTDTPTDTKNNENLINIKEISVINEPILSESIQKEINRFLLEQNKKFDLMKAGLRPANSIILYGEPGVGKTYSATWIAYMLKKPLIVVDLATLISSYLGHTGNNIKKVLDYAKENECILFLDEFDALAKTRSDEKELGEMKRIVNVLLKELEEWPIGGIVIAATNHDELLDKAIWRRFDLKIHLDLPELEARKSIIQREFTDMNEINSGLTILMAKILKGENCAEIVRICSEIKRESILFDLPIIDIFIKKCSDKIHDLNKNMKTEIVKELKNMDYKASEISELTGIPGSTVYKYL